LVQTARTAPSAARRVRASTQHGKGRLSLGDAGEVEVDEALHERGQLLGRGHCAFGLEAVLDEVAGAAADEAAGAGYGQGRQAALAQYDVKRADQVGGGVHQRAIEVESDYGAGKRTRGGHGWLRVAAGRGSAKRAQDVDRESP
jgi:hypothetical protein